MKTKKDFRKDLLLTILKTDQVYVEVREQLKQLESRTGYDYQARNVLNRQLRYLEELINLNEDLVDNCLEEEP